MRRLIPQFLLAFLSLSALGQMVNEMEYFFDNDPGYGMGTSVTITPGATINELFNAPTGALSAGFHDLFVRLKETGGVQTISALSGSFEVGEIVTGSSSAAMGTVLASFDDRLEISTTGVFTASEGLTGGTSGATATLDAFTANWSLPESRLVYVDPAGAGTVLVEELEYFFDADPGYGMGTTFTAFTAAGVVNEMASASTGTLALGFHTLYVRAKAVGGVWGIPESRVVYVDPSGTGAILVEELEYFFDQDPGYGMGTAFTAFTAANVINQIEMVPTGALATGFHTLFIRAKSAGDTWGVPESRLVYVDPTGAGAILVEEIEYFFDSDPGYGMGSKFTAFTAAAVVNELENAATGSLSVGFHTLFVRAKTDGGTWGIPESRLVYVDPSGAANTDITAIEYFFGTDPGVGMATSVSITTPGFTVNEMFSIPAGSVPLGENTLGIRAQNADGVWGMLETKSITNEKDNALNFDGSDDFVVVPDAIGLDLTSAGTLTAWVNPSDLPTDGACRSILAKSWGVGGQNQNAPYQLMLCGSGDVQVILGDNTNAQVLKSTSSILPNEWSHVAATWDGSDLTLFINGVAVGSVSQTTVPLANTEDLYIGSMDGLVGWWQGDLDEISIWNVSSTAAEIQDILTSGLDGTENDLISYYAFDEGDAGIDNTGIVLLPDQTSNTNDGTVTSFSLTGITSNWVEVGVGKVGQIPGEPVELSVVEVSATQIDLSWVDRSFNEDDFVIERSLSSNTAFSQIGTVSADEVTFSDNTVTAGNGYFYRVKATNASGDSPYTSEKFGSTIIAPGNSLQFDGVDDYVDVGEIGLDFTSSSFTIEFWAKRDAIGADGDWIINVGEEPSLSNESIHAGFVSSNQFSFDFKGDALTTDESFTDTDWHHWAVIYDPDALGDDDDRKIYLDGELLKEDDPTAGFSGTNYFKIGQAFGSQFFGGIVDEVRVWDDVRTDTEILSFINTTLVGNEANLIAYYRLDQDQSTDLIVPDRTINDHPGTWVDGGGGVTTPQWVASQGFNADTTPPSVVTQDISVSLDASGNISITTSQIDNGSSDDQTSQGDLLFSLDISSFDCTNLGDNTVVLSVMDETGKSADGTATVTVVDDMLPNVVTQDFSITLDASDQAIVQPSDLDNGSSDNCMFTLSLDITSFGKTELGDNTVTLTAIDDGGNSVSETAIVTVIDNNNPPVVVTQNITVSLDAAGNVSITPDQINNGSTDDITATGDLVLSLDITSFDCSNVGDNMVSLSVTDESSETSTAPAIVTVVDDLPPVVVTRNFEIMLDASDQAVIQSSDVDNGTSDNCSVSLSLDINTFTKDEVGENAVTLTATDAVGNSSSETALVTVLDNNQAPEIFYTFYLDENTQNGKLVGRIVATDPEGDPLTYSIASGNTDDAFSIDAEGNLTVSSSAALDYEVNPTFMLTVQADDGLGGIAMVAITINLNDIDEDVLGVGSEIEVSIYPNPVEKTLFLNFASAPLGKIEVKLFTISGRQVLIPASVQRESDQLLLLDLEGMQPGMYLLKVVDGESVITRNVLMR